MIRMDIERQHQSAAKLLEKSIKIRLLMKNLYFSSFIIAASRLILKFHFTNVFKNCLSLSGEY